MRRAAIIFMLAIVTPSLALAWVAARSLRDREAAGRQQRLELYRTLADSRAATVAADLEKLPGTFGGKVAAILRGVVPRDAAARFDSSIRAIWPLAELGFVVSREGEIIEPSLFSSARARKFRLENERFLSAGEGVEVRWDESGTNGRFPSETSRSAPGTSTVATARLAGENPREEARFRQLIGDKAQGLFARFLQDSLHLMVWHCPVQDPQMVFGARIDLDRLVTELRAHVNSPANLSNDVSVALLDDRGKAVAFSRPVPVSGAPIARARIGEALPHWEVAIYDLNPGGSRHSVLILRVTLGLLIILLVVAIAVGGWLIGRDVRRQLTLARQKADFVSNVSHELKTPLTSIRMFSEMLAEGHVLEEARQRQFLQIITAETGRLTRLINNVLDFARLERREMKYRFEPCDLSKLARNVVESYRPHLERSRFTVNLDVPVDSVGVRVDADAITQIILNLLSNAEKYSGNGRTIDVILGADPEWTEVKILDRGPGVRSGCEERIFEQFFRGHDSLASGIPGCGLGLTLARQVARAHGGDVTYHAREGGGSCFTLRLPISAEQKPVGG